MTEDEAADNILEIVVKSHGISKLKLMMELAFYGMHRK